MMKRENPKLETVSEKNSLFRRFLPKSISGRVILASILFSATVLFAVFFAVFSVWIENRFPSADAKTALFPASQRVVTKPVVEALGRQAERYMRRKVEASYLNTGLTLEETIARFLDEKLDLSQRRDYAYRLARIGSPDAIAALFKVLGRAAPEHKAFIAQLIGSTGNPAVKDLLWPLLKEKDERVVAGAIRGLSAIAGEDVVTRVSQILADAQLTEKIRIEAAIGLGTMGSSSSRVALVATFDQTPSTELKTQILDSLSRFEFPEIADTFISYLAAPETPQAMRVTAVEALANSSAESVPFLLGLAEGDTDADVRASSAWAISVHNSLNNLGPALTSLVEREPVADVRRRLYEALLPQAIVPSEQLLPIVQAEVDIAARVAGFNVLGHIAKQNPASATAAVFDKEIVPELIQIATAPNSLNIQMRAVFALRRAQTAPAQAALSMIANNAAPRIATAARNGLRPSS